MTFGQFPHLLSVASPALLLAALLAAGCAGGEVPRTPAGSGSPRDQYQVSLRLAGLDTTAAGRAWLQAGERALRRPHRAPLPHREALILAPGEAGAVAFAFELRRGERLWASVQPEQTGNGRVLVDLLALPDDSAAPPRPVEHAAAPSAHLAWAARGSATYLLRVQPELHGEGRFIVTLRTTPSLAFPVADRNGGAIGSPFGAPRDGGRRRHHGVDIFAPRGTPVIAAAAGTVRSVRTTPIGGRVVWLRDGEQGLSLYYAHLDSQTVSPGARVRPGDTLGTVGTTGNARGTPPHLHFGIYRRGPVDPVPFVAASREPPPPIRPSPSLLGSWHRTVEPSRLEALAGDRAEGSAIAAGTAVLALGTSRGRYRVRLADGAEGYLPADAVAPLLHPPDAPSAAAAAEGVAREPG